MSFVSLLCCALVVQACGAANPLAKAETVEQRGYAVYGTFMIAEEQAAKLVTSGELSDRAIIAIGDVDKAAKPAAEALVTVALEYAAVKRAYEAGETTEDSLSRATLALDRAISNMAPLIADLVAAIKGGT